MLQSARSECKRVALSKAMGTISVALKEIKIVTDNLKKEPDFFSDVEVMAHGFACALLSNSSLVVVGEGEIDMQKVIGTSVQAAMLLREHMNGLRVGMEKLPEGGEQE
jgi:hypothetical protein